MSTYLFIDGTNLYAAQYELVGPSEYIDFSRLIKHIETVLHLHFDKIFFYASYSPKSKKTTEKELLYLKNEAFFYRNVRKTENVTFFTGYRSKTSGKEKEVDVKLTADLITFAFLKKYHQAFLLTGDADFLQALFSIKNNHKAIKIRLLCMENKIMYQGLFYFKTSIIVLRKEPIFQRRFQTLSTINLSNKKLVLTIKKPVMRASQVG